MRREDIEPQLHREPFIPLRFHLSDGRKLDIPFDHVVIFLSYGMLVFKGVKKAGSRVAKGYEVVAYEAVERVEQRPGRGPGQRRKKAS